MYYNKGTNKVAYTFPPYHIGNPLGTRVSGGLSFFNNKATMKRFFDCAQNDNTVTVKKDPPFVWGIILLFGALFLSFDQSGIGARLQIDALDKQEQQRIEYRGRSALEEVAVHKADQDHR